LTPRIAQRNTFAFSKPTPLSPPLSGGRLAPSLDKGRAGEGLGWRSGQRVFHQKFGEGTITGIEGSGADSRVQVNFRKAGVKWLALEYAKLTAL
jgi:DNA helicase-2/ATP-dependent DNA helicase PcrA